MVNQHPLRIARRRSLSPTPTSEAGMCLREVRECYDVGPRYQDAAEAWREADHKHPTKDPATIPRGVPVFWTGGSDSHGHVAIATGYRSRCFSTDIRRPGYFDQVPIEEIHAKWGLTLVGWTEDLNGVRVWRNPVWEPARVEAAPAATKKPAKKAATRKATT